MIQILTSWKSTESSLNFASHGLKNFFERKGIGFPFITERRMMWDETIIFSSKLRSSFDTLVVVGIGGSALGARAICEIFEEPDSEKKLLFADNLDPVEFQRLLKKIKNFETTAWLFISKSGSTIETLSIYDFARQHFEKQKLSLIEKSFFITERKGNPLYNLAKAHHRPFLELPADIGGRYSVLTSVGMLPASFLGLDIAKFREGAAKALQEHQQVITAAAAILDSFDRQEWISLLWFYSSLAKSLGGWLQQLWAESLGKKLNRLGQPAPFASFPSPAIGAIDQHSILQQVAEGQKDKLVCFFRFLDIESKAEKLLGSAFSQHDFLKDQTMGEILGAEAEATAQALTQGGVSNITFKLPDLSPSTLGYFFMFWQLVIASLGEVLQIDAFDQPGVELGKRLAKDILKST